MEALGTGTTAAATMALGVVAFMPLQSITIVQYRHGKPLAQTCKALYRDGGVVRFYRGFPQALVIAPLARWGDTTSNQLALTLLEENQLPMWAKTGAGAVLAALFRVAIFPLDTWKVTMQVQGATGLEGLRRKARAHGMQVLYHGAVAAAASNIVGYYPWYLVHNELNARIPDFPLDRRKAALRNGFVGFAASAAAAVVSNAFRVLKVYRQSNPEAVSYLDAFHKVVQDRGVLRGLVGRGLPVKLGSSALQGFCFNVVWKELDHTFVTFNRDE